MEREILRRFVDVVASGAGLVLLSPLFAAVAISIKVTGRGPVFFRQERVGLHGTEFSIYKFRTMVVDAAHGGSGITVGGDVRVTRVGRFLRRFKIDELPQLINVLRGEMTLVGPRPELPQYVAKFCDAYEPILRLRPGITHRASILYRDEEELLAAVPDPERFYVEEIMPTKLRLYTRDLDRDGFRQDVLTILQTLACVARISTETRSRQSVKTRRPVSRGPKRAPALAARQAVAGGRVTVA